MKEMKDELKNYLRRAAAEGYTAADIRSAANKIETRELACLKTGPKAGDGGISAIGEMAERIYKSERYVGGYMYPGTVWSSGLKSHQPTLSSKVEESDDGSPAAVISAILEAMVEGTIITETTNMGNGVRWDSYVRVAEGFRHVGYSDEQEDKFLENQIFATTQAVADELGVAHSATLVALCRIYL